MVALKKVLIMANGLYSGGAEKILQNILNNLDYGKYSVTLYSMRRYDLDPEIFKTQGSFRYKSVFRRYNGKPSLLKSFFDFTEKIKGRIFQKLPAELFRAIYIRGKFDVEIAFIEGEATKVVSGSLNKKSKKIAWVHTDLIKNSWTHYLYKNAEEEARAYKKFNEVICVSESVKDAFCEKYGIKDTVSVKYNPVDSDDILLKSKEKIDITVNKRPLIFSVGRLEQPKGYPRLCECALKLKNEGLDFTLWILGDGVQREQLRKYIEENELSDTVKLLGFQDNPYKYISKADAFICSSYAEGFSTAATESIILGKPVYTVDCPGMKELFGDESCGEIVDNTDKDLYLLLKHAVTDKEALEKYTAGAERRSGFFNIKKRMEDFESIIQ